MEENSPREVKLHPHLAFYIASTNITGLVNIDVHTFLAQ